MAGSKMKEARNRSRSRSSKRRLNLQWLLPPTPCQRRWISLPLSVGSKLISA